MTTDRRLLIPLFCFMLASAGAAADDVTTCERAGALRTITVESPSREPGFVCRVLYQKEGSSSVPWSARRDQAFCGLMAAEFVDKHKGWGFACRGGSAAAASVPVHWIQTRIDSVVGEFLRQDAECGLHDEVLIDTLPGLGEVAVTTHSCLVDGRRQGKLVVLIQDRPKPVLVPIGIHDNSARPVEFAHGVIQLDTETQAPGSVSASDNMRARQAYAVNEDGSVTPVREPGT